MVSDCQRGDLATARTRLRSAMDELETFVNASNNSSIELQNHQKLLEEQKASVTVQLDSVISRLRTALEE